MDFIQLNKFKSLGIWFCSAAHNVLLSGAQLQYWTTDPNHLTGELNQTFKHKNHTNHQGPASLSSVALCTDKFSLFQSGVENNHILLRHLSLINKDILTQSHGNELLANQLSSWVFECIVFIKIAHYCSNYV